MRQEDKIKVINDEKVRLRAIEGAVKRAREEIVKLEAEIAGEETTIYPDVFYNPATNRFFEKRSGGKVGCPCEYYNDAHTVIRALDQTISGHEALECWRIKSVGDLHGAGEMEYFDSVDLWVWRVKGR